MQLNSSYEQQSLRKYRRCWAVCVETAVDQEVCERRRPADKQQVLRGHRPAARQSLTGSLHRQLDLQQANANHCIFCCPLLSPVGIALELKDIHMSSPDVNMNYIKSLLFHDVCIEIVTVKQSALSLFSFSKFGFMCVYVSIFYVF